MPITTILASISFCFSVGFPSEFPPHVTVVWYLCLVKGDVI